MVDIIKYNAGNIATVKKFPLTDIIPHIDGNNLKYTESLLFDGFGKDDTVYCVHSYYAESCAQTITEYDYILPSSAAPCETEIFMLCGAIPRNRRISANEYWKFF